jgi:sialic acid synthase SpsE
MEIKIGSHIIGETHPTYFIADISANHDGDLERAKLLIRLAQESGADAAKFQNFSAPLIVSDYGFTHMGGQVSHQATRPDGRNPSLKSTKTPPSPLNGPRC